MIIGAHVLLYSTNPDADRAFLRDALSFAHVDVGHGWLIFALPPSEVAVHPIGADTPQDPGGDRLLGAELYLMCDDVRAQIATLTANRVACAPLAKESWGLRTAVTLPSGGRIGLYQPTHQTAVGLRK